MEGEIGKAGGGRCSEWRGGRQVAEGKGAVWQGGGGRVAVHSLGKQAACGIPAKVSSPPSLPGVLRLSPHTRVHQQRA